MNSGMKKYSKIAFIVLIGSVILACNNVLRPKPDNSLTEDQVLENPTYAEGLLLNAYNALPSDYTFGSAVASDNAVTNNKSSNYLKMATGEWSSTFNPLSEWNTAYQQIYYINKFLTVFRNVTWSHEDSTINELHKKRLAGEAYGLRAWYEFKLLQAHAGKTSDGKMLGFPIVTQPVKVTDNWELPRNTFSESIQQILTDCDSALTYLPDTYHNESGDLAYNAAMGSRFQNRIQGLAVKALKSKVTLLAASPSFNPGNDQTLWVRAAESAGEMLKDHGGLSSSVSPSGELFYTNPFDPDIIWSRAATSTMARERSNFPPSLLGDGNTDPTQDLVDAFPMKNGYPITDPNSGYDPQHPYQNRDTRLTYDILYNGSDFKDETINTYEDAPLDGINVQTNSTRTGYYLRKFMFPNVNIENPAVTQLQFYTYARWTEVLLNYAEAANEAWGPDGDPNNYGFTARDVIAAIRKRAGIDQPDAYLNSLTAKDQFRTLVHNERRIELCFEGHRFWDLRRWDKKSAIANPVNGIFIKSAGSDYTYTIKNVETRAYRPYMIYGPIPYSEILKDSKLVQNAGW